MQGLRQRDQVSRWLQSKNSLLGQKKQNKLNPEMNKKNPAKTCLILSHFVDSSALLCICFSNIIIISYCALIMYLSPQQSQTFCLYPSKL